MWILGKTNALIIPNSGLIEFQKRIVEQNGVVKNETFHRERFLSASNNANSSENNMEFKQFELRALNIIRH